VLHTVNLQDRFGQQWCSQAVPLAVFLMPQLLCPLSSGRLKLLSVYLCYSWQAMWIVLWRTVGIYSR
jgi:hypothetical protein